MRVEASLHDPHHARGERRARTSQRRRTPRESQGTVVLKCAQAVIASCCCCVPLVPLAHDPSSAVDEASPRQFLSKRPCHRHPRSLLSRAWIEQAHTHSGKDRAHSPHNHAEISARNREQLLPATQPRSHTSRASLRHGHGGAVVWRVSDGRGCPHPHQAPGLRHLQL